MSASLNFCLPGSFNFTVKTSLSLFKTRFGRVTRPESHRVTRHESHRVTRHESHSVTRPESHRVTRPESHRVTRHESHRVTRRESHRVTRPESPLCSPPSGHLGGWTTPWSAEEVLGGQHQREDIRARARTVHFGWKRISAESSAVFPRRPNRSSD